MKKYVVMDILDIIFIPLITYLLLGLLLIQLCGLPVSATYFTVWGVMAGIVFTIQKWFSNKAVTVGIIVYALAMVLGFAFYVKEDGMLHGILICVSFAALFLLRFLMQKRIIKIMTGYISLGVMIYYSIIDVEFSRILIGFVIILFLNAVSETIALFYSGNVKSLIVIYVIVAMVSLVMPVSKEPYGWDFVVKFIDTVEKVVERIVTEINYQMADAGIDGIFHFGGTGYSDEDMNLSNSLMEQDVEQLVILGGQTKRNLYLKGNVCNEYVGNTWKNNIDGNVPDYRVDTLMTLYAIFQETEDVALLRRFMEVKEQEVTLRNIKTKSLFYPVKLLDISVDDMEYEGDSLRASKVNGRGYSYTYYFIDIDYANKHMVDILKNSSEIVYEEEAYKRIYTNMKEFYGVELEWIPFEEFCRMAEQSSEMAKEQYMNIGDPVSQDVWNLAEEITVDCKGDYEVCKELEKYLYRYHYNKGVSVPENVNVLDWFLFEGKEGYCVHYATALAVMLRCEEIPTRVAEGFLVDYKDIIDSQTYSISSNKAHAWVEAYIDGFGWIRLEPTVVNGGNANAVWYAEEVAEEIEEEEIVEKVELSEKKEKEKQRMSWVLMIKLLLGMVVSVGIIMTGLLIYKKISIRRSNNPDVVFLHLISVLEKKYFVKNQSETLHEYFKRVCLEDDMSKEMKNELLNIQSTMEMYWYGNGTISREDIVRMKNVSGMK